MEAPGQLPSLPSPKSGAVSRSQLKIDGNNFPEVGLFRGHPELP